MWNVLLLPFKLGEIKKEWQNGQSSKYLPLLYYAPHPPLSLQQRDTLGSRRYFCIFRVSSSIWFLIILQWKEEKPYTFHLSRISTGLNLLFIIEVLMKLIAFTPRGYWQSRRNRYDLLVTILGANWICINYHLQVRINENGFLDQV